MSRYERSLFESWTDQIDSGDAIALFWTIRDVQGAAESDGKELTDVQARTVLRRVRDGHDAEHGVSWTEISYYTDEVLADE